ncbi:MAG: RluA family pseudouridine synthase [Lachnospiraceae bacterium]|nr:RluA family pseudouridine synthase [Lachnospiraceae bacterium]
MRIYEADENTEGMKVLTFVSRLLPKAPGSLIYRCIRQKKIKVNKKRTEAGYRLKAGDAVSVWLDDERLRELSGEGDGAELSSASPTDRNSHESEEEYGLYVRIYRDLKDRIPVISEDRDIIVFDKPAGLLSQSAVYGDENLNSFLIGLLLERGETGPELLRTVRPAVMSRLDRNTTGLVLCGKTISGEQYLARALRDRSLKKYYLAAVHGITRLSGSEEAWLLKDRKENRVRVSGKPFKTGGYRISTGFERISADSEKDISMLKVELKTGRPHQIRAHMAFLGHPVLGDPKYGDRERDRKLLKGDGRLYLHSYIEELPDGRKLKTEVPERFLTLFEETGEL